MFFYDNRLSNFPLSLADASHESQIYISVSILTIKFSQWAHMNFYSYRKNMYCDSTRKLCCFGKLLSMRGGCNQRLQSLLHLNLITAHNAHCQDIRDKLTCWYGSYLRTVATWQTEYIVQELRCHTSREHV